MLVQQMSQSKSEHCLKELMHYRYSTPVAPKLFCLLPHLGSQVALLASSPTLIQMSLFSYSITIKKKKQQLILHYKQLAHTINVGVPSGLILGSTLCLLYINGLLKSTLRSFVNIYAEFEFIKLQMTRVWQLIYSLNQL